MVHFPGHMREAFRDLTVEWAASREDPPKVARFEENYEPQEEPVDEFLRRFLSCDDVLPGEYRQAVSVITDLDDDRVTTYAAAAHELLVVDGRRRNKYVGPFFPAEVRDAASVIAAVAGRVDNWQSDADGMPRWGDVANLLAEGQAPTGPEAWALYELAVSFYDHAAAALQPEQMASFVAAAMKRLPDARERDVRYGIAWGLKFAQLSHAAGHEGGEWVWVEELRDALDHGVAEEVLEAVSDHTGVTYPSPADRGE